MPETPSKAAQFRQAIPTPVHLAEPIAAVRDGLESIKRGEGEIADQVLERIRRKHKIPDPS